MRRQMVQLRPLRISKWPLIAQLKVTGDQAVASIHTAHRDWPRTPVRDARHGDLSAGVRVNRTMA